MRKILLLITALIISQNAISQSYQIMNSASGYLVAFQPLVKEKEIFGYVELRKIDMQDSITNVYKYIVLDKNMNQVCNGNIEEDTYKKEYSQRVTEIEYNNGHILFGFVLTYWNSFSGAYYNISNSYKILDVETNKIISGGNLDKNFDLSVTNNRLDKNFKFHEFYALNKDSYLIGTYNRKTKENGYYAINFKGEEIWKQDFIEKDVSNDVIYNVIEKDETYIILLYTILKKERKISDNLLIIDTKTGKKIALTPLINDEFSLKYLDIDIKNEKIQIVGRYFEKQKEDKVQIDESLGLYRRVVDLKSGKIESDIFLPFGKFNSLDIDENGRVRKEGYLYFQTVDLNPDGSYFVLAETSKKGKYFNELYVFLLDKDFAPIKVEKFDVKKTRGDKYSFSQDLPNKVGKAYFFYDKTEEAEYELNILNFMFDSKTFTTTKMDLKNEKSSIRVMPAKTGFVGIVEYFKDPKKEGKSMEIRLEKLNYERQ